ncbi:MULTISPECIES: Ig-like domain-containing protein [unclassified Chryseobacterium]|uniref:Ig-like domain-containing protein n=1 Tax=unclassified Chryseobacterium TaxID=2593645 RepID=UPI00226A6265|nr:MULTISPECIES: Ig-like domain-containing protein [unclassified Chryseobacterium]
MKRFLLFIILAFLVQSCARVGSPVGGPKDSIAPKFLSSNIDTTRINVSRNIRELRLDFDEYVTLKDINKNLIISPPIQKIKRILPSGIANKYVLIQWEDTLQANTTYNFNFGNSISDNNEANVLPYFNFAFSTGDKLDDLYISGEVKDALNTKKQTATTENKLVVGLYQVKDTINYKQKPYYITKVDTDGYYELNYLSPGKYKIIAFEDENSNSVYDPGKEKVGFQKDPIEITDKSVSRLKLKVYPSKKPLKYGEMKEVPGGILMTFEGHPNDVKVLSLNDKIQDYKVTHTPKSDSIKIWFDAVKDKVGQETTENLKFSYDVDKKQDTVSVFYKYNAKNKMTLSNNDGNLLPPKTNFKITSNYIINKIEPEKWTLKSDSLTTQTFTAKISETNPYQVLIQSDFEVGKKYQLTVPSKTVSSFYDRTADPYRFDFEADKVENYGSLTFKLQNRPDASYWIQLLDSSEKVLYQKYVNADEVKFDILKPAEYVVRILVDNNGNKYWDEADFEHDIFAEDSFVYYKTAIVKQLWDSVETWDLKDTRTLDNPKGTVAPTPAPPTPADTKNDEEPESKPVLKDSNTTPLKSNTAVVTPVK